MDQKKSSFCDVCIPGRANNFKGQTLCLPCKENTFASGVEQKKCLSCPRGRSSVIGQSLCTPCGSGTKVVGALPDNNPRHGAQYECMPCKAGKFSSQQDAKTCEFCSQGQYQNKEGMSSCLICHRGSYQDETGVAETGCKLCKQDSYANDVERTTMCSKCPSGRTSNKGDTKCSNCPGGKFIDSSDNSCQFCPAGYAQPIPDQLQCEMCARGDESLKQGGRQCSWCDLGKFGVAPGKPCESCQAGRYQDDKRASTCKDCPADTYSSALGATSLSQCESCSVEKTTSGIRGSIEERSCWCRAADYFQTNLTVAEKSSSSSNSNSNSSNGGGGRMIATSKCIPCPNPGAKCTRYDGIDGVTIEEIHPLPGFWRANSKETSFASCERALVGQEKSLQRARERCCPLNSSLKDISTCDLGNQGDAWQQDHQCLAGYMGPLCMVCDEENGFIRVGHDCLPCAGGSDITGAVMSLVGVCAFMMVCVFVYVLFVKPPKILHKDSRTDKDHFTGVVVILVSYMQIISVMARTVSGSVKLPNEWVAFSNGMFFVNFDLAFALPFVSCRLSIPYVAKLMLHMATPICFFIVIESATFLATCVRRHKSELLYHAQKNAGLTILQNLGILLYPSLTTRIFSGFRCYNVEGVGYRLESDFSIPCWENGGSHEVVRALAIGGTILYTIGFPTWIFFDLWRHRKSLHDPSHDDYTLTRLRLGAQYEQCELFFFRFFSFFRFSFLFPF